MAFAELIDSRLVVQTEWAEKDLIKQVPGSAWDTRRKVWTVPLSWASCIILRGIFGDRVQIGPRLNEWAWNERETRITPTLAVRERTTMLDDESPESEVLKSWR